MAENVCDESVSRPDKPSGNDVGAVMLGADVKSDVSGFTVEEKLVCALSVVCTCECVEAIRS